MTWRERIIIDPAVLAGKPIIKGTRLAVEFIIDLLARDWSESEIFRNYPGLTHEDIQAYLSYASDLLREEKVYPLEISQIFGEQFS
jgi:uncharacterized protein (DUF433 family)